MFTSIKKNLLLLFLFSVSFLYAETVPFPSKKQPGTANLSASAAGWIFSNNLFSASYTLNNGKLFFGGSPEMNLEAGTELFQIVLGNGTKINASSMNWIEIKAEDLTANTVAPKYSERLNGKALTATLTYNTLTFKWRAVLRDGSHYLRSELEISTSANTPMMSITPMMYKVANNGKPAPVVVGNTRGAVVASDNIFAGVETPLAFNMVSGSINPNFKVNSWKPESWITGESVPADILRLGFKESEIVSSQGNVTVAAAGTWRFDFRWSSGSHRMNLTGVDIVQNGVVVASDYHVGFTGLALSGNVYSLSIPAAGTYTLRYWGETRTETITSSGTITATSVPTGGSITAIQNPIVEPFTNITGKWSRNTTLQPVDTFKVSSVVGLIASGQKRRSFLSYHERERAVPWRSFTLYNSWYELGISVYSNTNPLQRMLENQCLPIINSWKTNLYDTHKVGIDAFVWDDGWDDFNSLWNFHQGFPDGFKKLDTTAKLQETGTGAWLGPVGGYDPAKGKRLAFWNSTHDPDISNFELSNKEYFDAFIGRCSQMINDYDMRYFKFDGISPTYEAFGPINEEDAEGILKVITTLRKKRPDLFINTTVGTWASPFWFQYSDCVWRQRDDFDRIGGQGSNREQWITYRDQLVYKNFVSSSPLCPINTIMTHGLILTKFGPPNIMSKDNSTATLNEITKEMRCAFASGSGMVELYVDNDLMSSIGNKVLWKELSECIKWHRNNKDVLADVHWVGGNPWDGSKVNVYGWASWNTSKSTLTLRNPASTTKTFTTTLRQAMDIPTYITGKIKLTDAFASQTQYVGISNAEVDIDASITFNMPAFDVVVLNGVVATTNTIESINMDFEGSIYGEKRKIVFEKMSENISVQVMDLKGLLVNESKQNNVNFTLSVPTAGIYIVKLINTQGVTYVKKVICK